MHVQVGKGIFLTMRDTIQENNPNPIPNPEIEYDVNASDDNAFDDADFSDSIEYFINNEHEIRNEENSNNRMEDECEEIVYDGD